MSLHQNLPSLTVKGAVIPSDRLAAALDRLPHTPFRKAVFAKALKDSLGAGSLADDADAVRRIMQQLKRQGVLLYDAQTGLWRQAQQTLQLPSKTARAMPLNHKLAWLLAHLICLSAILALVLINANFAYELGETPGFRIAFVLGLLASDVMRPLLFAKGLHDLRHQAITRGATAVTIALLLSPVSLVSSASVISASLVKGLQEDQQSELRLAAMQSLEADHQRQLERADELRQAWKAECERGGCGAKARALEAKVTAAELRADQSFASLTELREQPTETSSFMARTAKSLNQLPLLGSMANIWLPILLAITLELAAVFGPALLLTRPDSKMR